MKAAVIEQFGDVETIEIKDVAVPEPARGEVQIQAKFVSCNPVEWKITAGYLKDVLPHSFPLILGWDVSGVVTKLGDGVETLSVGDEVYGYCRKPTVQMGTFAEYCCFDAEHVVKKPSNLSFAEAAAIPLVGLTAWQALFDVAKVTQGQSCLIHAGAGGVGSLAIQLAKWAGAEVITTASSRNHEYCKSLGADVVIDYNTTDFVERVKELHPNGVDFVFDCVGGETHQRSYQLVKKGGWLVTITGQADHDTAKELGINASIVFVRPSGEQLQELKTLFEQGIIVPPAVEEMPLDSVVDALKKVQTEHTRGKIVLQVG